MHSKYLTLKIDKKLESFIIIIPKKVAKLATQRNKLRRRIKEIIRLKINTNLTGTIYTRKGVDELTFKELEGEVLEIFNKI